MRNVPGQATGPLPPAEVARRVVARMTTPLLPDDYLHMVNPLWSARELRGKVIEVIPETDDAATLVIKPGWGWNFATRPVNTSASASTSTGSGTGAPIRSVQRPRGMAGTAGGRQIDDHGQGDARRIPL